MNGRSLLGSIILSVAILAAALIVANANLGGAGGNRRGARGEATEPSTRQRPGSGTEVAAEATAIAVQTVLVDQIDLEQTVLLGGQVRARNTVVALPETSGTISSVTIEVGTRVFAGQSIAFVDPSRPGARFEESPIEAPITGTVIAVSVERGETVTITSPVATIATVDDLEIELSVPERYANALSIGDRVNAFTLASPDRAIEAIVSVVDPVINTATRSKAAVLRPDAAQSAELGLQPGMFVQVEFVAGATQDAVTVPVDAVLRDGAAARVFVVSPELQVAERDVELGIIAGGVVQITRGLTPGERVVLSGGNRLRDGMSVRVVQLEGEE